MARPKSQYVTIARIIWANIRKVQYLRNISDGELAIMLECSPRTLANWDNKPECITLATLQLFCTNAGISAAELIV
ncbi:MAG: hypothetical protein ACI4JQ_02040 [Ruminococcus sp.]